MYIYVGMSCLKNKSPGQTPSHEIKVKITCRWTCKGELC